jgi:hypothetical protein
LENLKERSHLKTQAQENIIFRDLDEIRFKKVVWLHLVQCKVQRWDPGNGTE